MERLKLYCQDVCRGEITLRSEGGRTEIRASMEDPGDGLYRAVLRGESGELMLGVLAPEGAGLGLCRKLYSRDLAGIGPLRRGEARCSFHFQQAAWRETCCPAQLFQGRFLQSRLRPIGRAWWRQALSPGGPVLPGPGGAGGGAAVHRLHLPGGRAPVPLA